MFNTFAQNIDCGYTLWPSRRGGSNEYMCNHNLCFGSKMRKLGLPLQTPVFLHKGYLNQFNGISIAPRDLAITKAICYSYDFQSKRDAHEIP